MVRWRERREGRRQGFWLSTFTYFHRNGMCTEIASDIWNNVIPKQPTHSLVHIKIYMCALLTNHVYTYPFDAMKVVGAVNVASLSTTHECTTAPAILVFSVKVDQT